MLLNLLQCSIQIISLKIKFSKIIILILIINVKNINKKSKNQIVQVKNINITEFVFFSMYK